jgi:hypothetical protein
MNSIPAGAEDRSLVRQLIQFGMHEISVQHAREIFCLESSVDDRAANVGFIDIDFNERGHRGCPVARDDMSPSVHHRRRA